MLVGLSLEFPFGSAGLSAWFFWPMPCCIYYCERMDILDLS